MKLKSSPQQCLPSPLLATHIYCAAKDAHLMCKLHYMAPEPACRDQQSGLPVLFTQTHPVKPVGQCSSSVCSSHHWCAQWYIFWVLVGLYFVLCSDESTNRKSFVFYNSVFVVVEGPPVFGYTQPSARPVPRAGTRPPGSKLHVVQILYRHQCYRP